MIIYWHLYLSIKSVFLKVCSTDSKGSATISQRIRGYRRYISIMVTLKFIYS